MAISENKKRVQVTLAKSTLEQLEELSNTSPFKKSDIIELALINYFNQNPLQNH